MCLFAEAQQPHVRQSATTCMTPVNMQSRLSMRVWCTFVALCATACVHTHAGRIVSVTDCDILVAGGSLASLAAALTAANVSLRLGAGLTTCFTDPTDWPGGQLTASAVPAVDYGPANGHPPGPNVPAVFNSLTDVFGHYNMGNCWVSYRCFEPQLIMDTWIRPQLASFPNLRLYLNTVIVNSTRDHGESGSIISATAVQRSPVGNTSGWESLTSTMWMDWYSPDDSPKFTKTTYVFTDFRVIIDATEFGDVLATSGVSMAQGIETPSENSTDYIDFCGQGTVMPLYISYGLEPAPLPDPTPPGSGVGLPFEVGNFTWARVWSYRRSRAAVNSSLDEAAPGEISNQNWSGGNDFDNGYLFLPVTSGGGLPWSGGVNVSALAEAEQRAYGWYHYYKNLADPAFRDSLSLNRTQVDTGSGLSKMPYLRDTRRSGMGIGGFRLMYTALSNSSDPGVPTDPILPHANTSTAYHFADTIGIGQYFYADIHEMVGGTCPYPSYVAAGKPVKPYYIPFRALTNVDAPNLLVAGKGMAQSFLANAATRLHPEEWVTGTAAGAAAILMAQEGWTSAEMHANVAKLQAVLIALGQPLNWTLPWPPSSVVDHAIADDR